jgi:hypothetical protein
MPRSTVLDLAQEEQAQMLAALRRAWCGYLLHGVFCLQGVMLLVPLRSRERTKMI